MSRHPITLLLLFPLLESFASTTPIVQLHYPLQSLRFRLLQATCRIHPALPFQQPHLTVFIPAHLNHLKLVCQSHLFKLGDSTDRVLLTASASQQHPSCLSADTFNHIQEDITFVEDHDEHADIATGDKVIDDSLLDDDALLDPSTEDIAEAAAAETSNSEIHDQSVLHSYLQNFKKMIMNEIRNDDQPRCYKDGQLYVRPRNPIFALRDAQAVDYIPDELYHLDIFVWLPEHLPGRPDIFTCVCGRSLTKNGMSRLLPSEQNTEWCRL